MEKKKVLLIAASNMSLSGVPVVFMSIIRSLSHKYTFDIVVLDDKDMYFENEFLSYGGKIFKYLNPKPRGILRKLVWFFGGFKRNTSLFIKNNLRLNDYCAIHSFSGEFGSILFKNEKKNDKVVKIFHVCSALSVYKEKLTIKQILWNCNFNDVYKYADKVLYVSKAALKYAKNRQKSDVLYNIYDEEKFNKIENCAHNNLSLTQIGTFSSRKNQLFSLKVLTLLKNSFPNVKLNIVGKEIEAGYYNRILEFIEEKSLKNNVDIFNDKTDRISINRNTSYVIYPSIQDSFGLVLIESQASGIHCFASNTIPQDADMGNIEFLPLNENCWADTIKEYFLKNRNKRIIPTEKDKFSKTAFAKKLISIYDQHNEKFN